MKFMFEGLIWLNGRVGLIGFAVSVCVNGCLAPLILTGDAIHWPVHSFIGPFVGESL
jgi:hypothetical protein